MAYNNYFPSTYQPYGTITGYNQYPASPYQSIQNPVANPIIHQQQNQGVQQAPVQQSGFILVQSEQEAQSYPVAPGNSITFKDERQPYCYVKTMGFNQLDRPIFERYRLVKEENSLDQNESTPAEKPVEKVEEEKPQYVTKPEIEKIKSEIDLLKKKIKKIEKLGVREDDE